MKKHFAELGFTGLREIAWEMEFFFDREGVSSISAGNRRD